MNSSSSPSPPSPPPPLLSNLAIFKNTLNNELMRSVHVYRTPSTDEGGERWVEREFLLSPTSCTELRAEPLFVPDLMTSAKIAAFREGESVGPWLCILTFDRDNLSSSSSSSSSSQMPLVLSSRNPGLKNVPNLVGNLQKLHYFMSISDNEESMSFASDDICTENDDEPSISVKEGGREERVLEIEVTLKKKRAATKHVAGITLPDLAKYFNLPISEASKKLKIGVTVLKRKCREFGISRWPHRKIKSLDTLIHDLEEEVNRQQINNEAAAATAAMKRQQKLEREKECIEKRPSTELQMETKRFRQDVFKRKHILKVQQKNC